MLRSIEAAEIIGIRAILVHAIDDEAVRFYEKFVFLPFPTHAHTLVLPIETARHAL
ncbi:MAG: hypothetical protein JO255_01655 [Alphaproteobacteria bacterium]|nr:hypothetical protein [Alphaproteobacteria bacterium]